MHTEQSLLPEDSSRGGANNKSLAYQSISYYTGCMGLHLNVMVTAETCYYTAVRNGVQLRSSFSAMYTLGILAFVCSFMVIVGIRSLTITSFVRQATNYNSLAVCSNINSM